MSYMNKNRSHVLGVMLHSLLYVALQLIIPISANHSPYAHKESIINYDCSDSTTAAITLSSKTAFPEDSNVTTVLRDSIKDSMGDPKYRDTYPCIITSQFSYTFLVITGGYKFIRLHFLPTSYPGLNMSKALFSVTVGPYTLLTTSESSYSSNASDAEFIVKEFCINVDGPVVNITFTPSRNSTGTFGFVNKIQIVSMPSNLYVRGDFPLPLLTNSQSFPKFFFIRNSIALETMHRVNVGGPLISAKDDTGMFRVWSDDTLYLIGDSKDTATVQTKESLINYSNLSVPRYTAPAKVYATARTSDGYGNSSLTWCFPLDSGFYYLIRLHFCNIARDIIGVKWVFQVYINNKTAEKRADVTQWSGDAACCVPMYRDYVVNCSSSLTLQLVAVGYNGAILNGLEIFKLSDHSNNLSGLYPFRSRKKPLEKSNGFLDNYVKLIIIPFGLLVSLVVLTIYCYLCLRFRQGWCQLVMLRLVPSKWKRRAFMQLGASSSDHCRYFSLAEINSATNFFSESNIIGAGGFGKVYQGQIDDSGLTRNVAIKRLSSTSNQGFHEFQTEITTLPKLRHCHLVSLIGFCMDEKEMILVYDFMARGTLRDHLYNTRKPPLPWKQRLEICIGAARGLHYLHAGTTQTIIHRDVKSTNILLDNRWVAKVADFGLSKAGPATLSCTHISTAVKGSFGYLDPEYYRRQKLTEKSDVYSFGVVLFEVLCARPAVLPMVEPEEEEWQQKVNLADWALRCHRTGSLDQIVDPYLMGNIGPECFKTFTEIATKCLADRGCDRPLMSDVLWNLELALLQQEGGNRGEERLRGEVNKRIIVGQVAVKIDSQPVLWVGNSDPTPGAEFSEIMVPSGR